MREKVKMLKHHAGARTDVARLAVAHVHSVADKRAAGKLIVPPDTRSSPTQARSIVDLPDPDGPMTATISPRRTDRLTPRSTSFVPKDFVTFISLSISITKSSPPS